MTVGNDFTATETQALGQEGQGPPHAEGIVQLKAALAAAELVPQPLQHPAQRLSGSPARKILHDTTPSTPLQSYARRGPVLNKHPNAIILLQLQAVGLCCC